MIVANSNNIFLCRGDQKSCWRMYEQYHFKNGLHQKQQEERGQQVGVALL